jgi:hypothetical protein
MFCGKVDKGTKFLLIHSTQEHAIDFDLGEVSIESSAETCKEVAEGAAGNFSIELGLKGIEAEVDGLNPSLLKLTGDGSEASSVGR